MWTGLYVVLVVAVFGTAQSELSEAEIMDAVIGSSVDIFKAATAGHLRNKMVSPLSTSILLALMDRGATGATSQQLQTALRLDHQQISEAYRKLSQYLQRDSSSQAGRSGEPQFDVANNIFVNKGVPVQEEFQQTAKNEFFTGLDTVPFGSPNASRGINSWAYQATRGEINSLVDFALPAETSMVLANAMYFRSPLSSPFANENTKNGTFCVSPGHNATVAFMHQETNAKTGSNSNLGVKWLHIPFKGEKYSLLVILPNKTFGLADVLSEVTSSDLQTMLSEGNTKMVSLYLPRLSCTYSARLVPALRALGISDLFSENSDLSNVSSQAHLRVSNVVQKVSIEINETQGMASVTSGNRIVRRSTSEEFVANHPFLAVIVKSGKLPLFMGTIIDPTQG